MARKAIIARERKREKMVAKYAEKRKALKEAGDYEALDKLPRNASPVRLHNRCKLTGRPRGYMRHFGLCRNQFRDIGFRRQNPWCNQSQLVSGSPPFYRGVSHIKYNPHTFSTFRRRELR